MRINNTLGLTAFEVLNNYKSKEILNILKTFEEDKLSYKLTKQICKRRMKYPFKMTLELSNLIKQLQINKKTNKHPATKIFHAIRIYINNELKNMEVLLKSSLKILHKNKNLIIITFNSLESNLVKKVIKNNIFKFYPDIKEIIYNNSSRSATMYIIKKL